MNVAINLKKNHNCLIEQEKNKKIKMVEMLNSRRRLRLKSCDDAFLPR